jgi:hypothetical protein
MGKLGIITRTVGVLSAVTVLGVGVTYASLSTTATLTGNSVTSATAALLVDGSDGDTTPTASEAGFSFANIIPGADFGTGETFTLQNDGTTDLKVTVYSTAGTATGVLNPNKVYFKFTSTTDATKTATYTLTQMKTSFNGLPGLSEVGASLPKDDDTTAGVDEGLAAFKVQVKMDEDAVSSGSASLSNFDFVFTGTAVVPPAVVPEP